MVQTCETIELEGTDIKQTPLTFNHDHVYAALTYRGVRTEIKISPHAVCLASPVWRKALVFPILPVEEDDQLDPIGGLVGKPLEAKVMETTHQWPGRGSGELDEYELVGDNFSSGEVGYQKYVAEEQDGQMRPHVQPRKILDLTEDDGDSALLLLRIAHLQFRKAPFFLSFNSLLNVATLCDYYNCVDLVRPWLDYWLRDSVASSRKPGQEEWLFIAWAFGIVEIFKTLASKMVLEVMTNDKQECLTLQGKIIAIPLPYGIVENILAVRHRTIQKLLEIPYSIVNDYITAAMTNKTRCTQREYGKECDAIVYGSLLISLQSISLWPQKKPEEIHMSVNQLVLKLRSVKTIKLPVYAEYRLYDAPPDHGECSLVDYKWKIDTVVARIESPVLDSHLKHMADLIWIPPVSL